MMRLPNTVPIPAPEPATPTVAAPAPMNLAAVSMSRDTAEVCRERLRTADRLTGSRAFTRWESFKSASGQQKELYWFLWDTTVQLPPPPPPSPLCDWGMVGRRPTKAAQSASPPHLLLRCGFRSVEERRRDRPGEHPGPPTQLQRQRHLKYSNFLF